MKELKNRYIAILKISDNSGYYDDRLIESITEWTEVTEAEYQALSKYQYVNDYRVVERPVDERAFILKTVEDYKLYVKKQQQEEEKRKEEAEKKKQERALKKLAKTQEDEKKLLLKLKEKYKE